MTEKEPIIFCQKPSVQYMQMLEECSGDPKSVAGVHALNMAGARAERGWQPDYDARDTRTNNFMEGWD